MTTEEALNELKQFFKIYMTQPFPEFANVAIEALEKQIPKKPVIDRAAYLYSPDYLDDDWSFKCSSCGQEFEFHDGLNFCPNCGQAIDWSEAEE